MVTLWVAAADLRIVCTMAARSIDATMMPATTVITSPAMTPARSAGESVTTLSMTSFPSTVFMFSPSPCPGLFFKRRGTTTLRLACIIDKARLAAGRRGLWSRTLTAAPPAFAIRACREGTADAGTAANGDAAATFWLAVVLGALPLFFTGAGVECPDTDGDAAGEADGEADGETRGECFCGVLFLSGDCFSA